MGILDANGLNNSELTNFVKQDTRSIFKNNPVLRKVANTLTDLGGYASALLQGGDLINKFSNELTNYEINDLMKHYKLPFHGCYIKDKLPARLSNGAYIVNLNGQSHWTALIKEGDMFYYFDSFGCPAPSPIEQRATNTIWSEYDIQSIASSSCGWFCIAWIRFMKNKKNKKKAYADFLKLFTSHTPNLL